MTFSLLTQMPVEVLSTRLWLPNTCPGVFTTATPGPSTTEPSIGRNASGGTSR